MEYYVRSGKPCFAQPLIRRKCATFSRRGRRGENRPIPAAENIDPCRHCERSEATQPSEVCGCRIRALSSSRQRLACFASQTRNSSLSLCFAALETEPFIGTPSRSHDRPAGQGRRLPPALAGRLDTPGDHDMIAAGQGKPFFASRNHVMRDAGVKGDPRGRGASAHP